VPQAPLEVVFRRVSTAVYKSSRGDQEPWIEGVIRQEFAFTTDRPSEPTASALASLSEDEIKTRVRALAKSSDEDLPTRVICDESGCFDYAQWAARLNQPGQLDALKQALQGLADQSQARFCVFNLDQFACPNDDPIKMTVIYPLAPILPTKYTQGFTWKETKVTSGGGVSFKFLPLLDRGGTPGTCLDADGSLQFARQRVDFAISRMTCFNLIVPGSIKQTMQVLMMDLNRREMIAYWDWNVISFLTYGSGRHLVKIKF
jgi:hypothetical protein